mgnify:CR=1 FL=1
MSKEIQISAVISPETREALERLVRATGLKKGHVVEMALLYHLRALAELPADILVPPVLTVTKESGKRVLAALSRPSRPTPALRRLMRSNGD